MCTVSTTTLNDPIPGVDSLERLLKLFRILDDTQDLSKSQRSAEWLGASGASFLQQQYQQQRTANFVTETSSDDDDDSSSSSRDAQRDLPLNDPIAKYGLTLGLLRNFWEMSLTPRNVEAYLMRVLKFGGPTVRSCVDVATLLLLRIKQKLLVECLSARKEEDAIRRKSGVAADCPASFDAATISDIDAWLVLPSPTLCRLTVAALLIATKLHFDKFPTPRHLAQVWGFRNPSDLIQYEAAFLRLLDFNVHIAPEDYQAFKVHLAACGDHSTMSACGALLVGGEDHEEISSVDVLVVPSSANFLRLFAKRFGYCTSFTDDTDEDPFISGAASSVHTPQM